MLGETFCNELSKFLKKNKGHMFGKNKGQCLGKRLHSIPYIKYFNMNET